VIHVGFGVHNRERQRETHTERETHTHRERETHTQRERERGGRMAWQRDEK